MGRTNLLEQGTITISIDLVPAAGQANVEHGRRLDETTDWLITTFGQLGIPATWAVADPAHSAATERLLTAELGHELAVLGDASWVGRQAGRSRFARELARRVLGSRAAGIEVTSLVPRDVEVDDHVDLLLKHGLTAVRGDVALSVSRQPLQPHALRFGLWEAPGSARLPARQSWLGGAGGGMAIRRAIRHSARQRRVFHLVIDAWRLAAGNVQDRKTVDRTLCVVRQLRERQLLRSETLADLAARLSHVPRTQPARSILRPAA